MNEPTKFLLKMVIIVLSIVFLATFSKFAYSSENQYESAFKFPNQIQNMINDTYTITTKTEYTLYNEKIIKYQPGIALHLGNGYFHVLTHVFEHNGYITFDAPYGMKISLWVEIEKQSFSITKKEIQNIQGYEVNANWNAELIGSYEDISLFKVPGMVGIESTFEFGDSSLLKLGDKISVIGNSFMDGINLKQGIISKFKFNTLLENTDTNNSYIITAPINGGDSGSVVLAINNNIYYVVGIVHSVSTAGSGLGFAFNINYVKGVLKLITQNVNFLD